MPHHNTLNRYLEPLLSGQRLKCRSIVDDALANGTDPRELIAHVVWPAMESVADLYRQDRINCASEHMATRINRMVADQLQRLLPRIEDQQRRVLVVCADDEPEELGAQICADLFEAHGWEAFFVGGGVPCDEITNLIGHLRPHLLLIYGSKPTDTPRIRSLVTNIREIGANPTMNVMVSGGVFDRAEGLWQEVQADLYASSPDEAIQLANDMKPRSTAPVVTTGIPKKRRRRRKSTTTEAQAVAV